jgi:carboxypeptidase PM20D1
MKRILYIVLSLLVILVIVILVRTFAFESLQVSESAVNFPVTGEESEARLSQAVTFKTISLEEGLPVDTGAFFAFHHFLEQSYPLTHSTLQKETVSSLSLLYRWEGKNTSLKPFILTAHMDVVPSGDSSLWQHPPFAGVIDDEFIWGRGTLDDKIAIIAILEATENLIAGGFQPERTVFFAFGHDEEINGIKGAYSIASLLKKRGIEAEFVLDEGLAVTNGMVPMIDKPVATVGTSEKGYLTVKLEVQMEGGHSSTPAKETAIDMLSSAVSKVMQNPMNSRISGPVSDFMDYTGPEMPFYAKAIFANRWLFKDIILNIYEGTPAGNAAVRTTIVPTIISGGVKENVVPLTAEAMLNCRILPGETIDDIVNHLAEVIDDNRVKITPEGRHIMASPVSPVTSYGFKTIAKTISQVYPEAVVSPMIMLGASDAKHYKDVSANIYRFLPVNVTRSDLARIHGLNERIAKADFKKSIGFYYWLIINGNM